MHLNELQPKKKTIAYFLVFILKLYL